MECPVCKSVFPKFKEILMIVDRVFYCHHCSSRLISYPDGEGGSLVEDDRTGEKWMAVEKATGNARTLWPTLEVSSGLKQNLLGKPIRKHSR